MKRKFTFHPKDYAIGQIEKYYSDMAAKGWHLEYRNMVTSSFLQGEPKDMKYRVEVASPKAFDSTRLPEEQVAVYEDCGWEYVWGHGFIHIFRAPADSDTEEFYLDPAQQATTLKKLRKDIFFRTRWIPFYLFFFNFLLDTLCGTNVIANMYRAWISLTGMMVWSTLFIGIIFAETLYGAIQINRLYKNLKKGKPLDHRPKQQSKLPAIIKNCLLVFSFVLLIHSTTMENEYPMPVESDGMYVTLSEYGISGERSTAQESEVGSYTSPFCQWWDCHEVLAQPNTWLYQTVYVMKNEKQTANMARCLMDTSTFAQKAENFSEMAVEGFDKVYYNDHLELVVIKSRYVGRFNSIFTEKSRDALLTVLKEKWV